MPSIRRWNYHAFPSRFRHTANSGLTGRNCRRWFQRGTRPTGTKDQRHTADYLFGAVCPECRAAFGLALPVVSTDVMQTFLDQLGDEVAPGAHALLVMDRAGWHCANDLVLPDDITTVSLPPYSPELNAIARLSRHLKEHFPLAPPLARRRRHRRCRLHQWQRVTGDSGRIKSLCSMEWAKVVKNQWGWYYSRRFAPWMLRFRGVSTD